MAAVYKSVFVTAAQRSSWLPEEPFAILVTPMQITAVMSPAIVSTGAHGVKCHQDIK